jgi:hypothetical protein
MKEPSENPKSKKAESQKEEKESQIAPKSHQSK